MMVQSLLDIAPIREYLARVGAKPRSLRTAVIEEKQGKYSKDITVIAFTRDGTVTCNNAAHEPTESEIKAIADACKGLEWPELKRLSRLIDLPEAIEKAPPNRVFKFYDLEGKIEMLQLRIDIDGEKHYIPYTYWTDNVWRKMEPEGKLPLWGLEQIQNHTTVFIHEGAKAARAVREMIAKDTPEARKAFASHPWSDELDNAAHLGWIGGALAPTRTDWGVLVKAGVKRAYIVSDNDAAGISAVKPIAFQLQIPTFHIQFTSEWPQGFDLADAFPEEMFGGINDDRYFIGPSFRSCLHPATWATDQIQIGKGKPTTTLRKHFKEMWSYVEEADLFVCVEMPEIIRVEKVMNIMLAPFSHTNQTSQQIIRAYNGRSTKLCYRPDVKGKLVTDNTTSAINLHTPTHIKSKSGDPKPFLEFIDYLFPNPGERKEVLRWCATLIARLDIRMEYGLLLVSEKQGVGKTTLGASILGPLVGPQNVSFPSANQVVQSDFNGWIANKRLCVINEIYEGQNWKAYNKLKTLITDKDIEVNEKFQKTYTVENWSHMVACSNSMQALRMEQDDRRWFYPEVTEDKWPRHKFVAFHNWLRGGGLSIIKHWAENFASYVEKGESAPMTERKKELISSSRSEGQSEAAELAESMNRIDYPFALAMKDIVEWVRHSVQGKVFDTDLEIRRAMKESGIYAWNERIAINGRLQYVLMNESAYAELRARFQLRNVKNTIEIVKESEEDYSVTRRRLECASVIKGYVKVPNDVMAARM